MNLLLFSVHYANFHERAGAHPPSSTPECAPRADSVESAQARLPEDCEATINRLRTAGAVALR